jgi:hypothetical protein
MFFLFQQSQELILALLKKLFKKYPFFILQRFLPFGQAKVEGRSGLAALLQGFAVDNHTCMPCASHMPQPRLVNTPVGFGRAGKR